MISLLSTLEMNIFVLCSYRNAIFFVFIAHLSGPGSAGLIKEIATEQIGVVGKQSPVFLLSGI